MGIKERILTVIEGFKTSHDLLGVENHYVLAADGELENHIAGSRVGSSDAITSIAFVILANASFSQPTVGQAMNIASTSSNDSSSGTGAQQVTIYYFTIPSGTIGWIKKSEVVTLNGTTPVRTTNSDIYRIDRMHVNRIGSSGLTVGTITVKDITNTLLFGQIDPGRNIMLRAIHYVPKLYSCVLSDMMMGVSTNGGVIFRIFATEEDSDGNTVTVGQLSIEINGPGSIDRSFNLPLVVSNPNAKNISIGIAVKSRTGSQASTGTIRFHDHPL